MKVILLLLACLTLSVAHAKNYYVDASSSSDPGDGQEASPFRTIQQCAAIATAGDVCLIRSGTYRETIRPANSGTSGQPITFKPASNADKVVVSGLDVVSGGWSVHSGSIYRTQSMTWDIYSYNTTQISGNQIFVDGKMMPEARWPNIAPKDVTSLTFDMYAVADSVDVTSNSSVTYFATGLTADFWTGGIVVHSPGFAWFSYTCDVTGSRVGSVDVVCNRKGGFGAWSWVQGKSGVDFTTPQGGNFFWLFGKLQALDAPGEWFYDSPSKTLYLWLEDSSSPSSRLVEAKRRQLAFDLRSRSYITIDGLSIFGARIRAEAATNIILKNLDIQYASHVAEFHPYSETDRAAVSFQRVNESQLIDSSVTHTSGLAYWTRGVRNLAKNNVFSHVSYSVDGNGVGSDFTGTSTEDLNDFVQNTVHTGGQVLIHFGNGQHIRYNDVYNSGLQRADLGLIYGYFSEGNGAEISYNWAHDCTSKVSDELSYFGCAGVYPDNLSNNYKIFRNVVWGVTSHAFSTIGGTTRTPGANKNVIMAYNTGLEDLFISADSNFENNLVQNNIFSDVDPGNSGIIVNNNFDANPGQDPKFVSVERRDFRLRSYSPARNRGIRMGAPYDDEVPSGETPDLGAYDSRIPEWLPGAMIRQADIAGLSVECSSTPGGKLDCLINGMPEGRKLPLGFEINVGPQGSTQPSGTASTCTTKFDYDAGFATGVCIGLTPPQGTNPGDALLLFVREDNDAQWISTGVETSLTSLSITTVTPNFGLEGTLITISGSAFPNGELTAGVFKYSAQITVTGPGNNVLFNYPVLLRVDTAALIAGGKMKSECQDLMFSDEFDELPFWMEDNTCNTAETLVWVKFSHIPKDGTSSITMSYGDPSASQSRSNPDNVFVYFEGFDDSTVRGTIATGNYFSVSVNNGKLVLTGSSDSSTQYTWIRYFVMEDSTKFLLRQFPFAIESELSVISAPTGWASGPGAANTGFVGVPVDGKKPISRQSNGWTQIGNSSVSSPLFESKKIRVGFDGSFSEGYTVRWFENYNFNTPIAQVDLQTNDYGAFWFAPQGIFANFEVRLDNMRARPFNFPEPGTATFGAELTSSNTLSVTVGGKPCNDVVVLSSGSIQCKIPALDAAMLNTWVDVTVTTNQNSATRTDAFFYSETDPGSTPDGQNTPGSGSNNPNSLFSSSSRFYAASILSLLVIFTWLCN